MILPSFKYAFLSGPVCKKDLDDNITEGNCRLAIQLFFYKNYNKYFKAKEILNPEGYKNTGKFIFEPGDKIISKKLQIGDVIYAQNRINKKGEKINRDRSNFDDEDEWILCFHTAIYIGDGEIYHATVFEDNACTWGLKKFDKFYKKIAVKRFL